MTRVEKGAILLGLGSASLFAIYSVMKPRVTQVTQSQNLIDRRQALLSKDNLRILYSTMTFFYLHSYQQTGKDLALFREVLDVAKPKFVALQLSESELESNFRPILRNPFFQEAMKKVDYYLTVDPSKVETMKELDFHSGLELLYAMHYCQQNNCKIICADETEAHYKSLFEAKQNLKRLTKDGQLPISKELQELYQQSQFADLGKSVEEIREDIFVRSRSEIFVEKIMKELKPQFSLVPDVPYKVLVGLVNPTLQPTIVSTWKNQFLSVYGHQILEGEEVPQEQ